VAELLRFVLYRQQLLLIRLLELLDALGLGLLATYTQHSKTAVLLLLPTLGQVIQEVCRQGHLSGHLDLLVPTRRQVRLFEDAAVGAVSRHHREQPVLVWLVVLVNTKFLVANSCLSQLDELVLVGDIGHGRSLTSEYLGHSSWPLITMLM
jgi:hypothetical protein